MNINATKTTSNHSQTGLLSTHQFLLTCENTDFPEKPIARIGDYNLFCHPSLSHSVQKTKDAEIHILGSIYNWEFPEQTNEDIALALAQSKSQKSFLSQLNKYMGHFVAIFKSEQYFLLTNDCCGQQEVYYDVSFSTFGSQVALIGKAIDLLPHSDKDALNFYQSGGFNEKRIFIGDTTHKRNVRHLLPNHFLRIDEKITEREVFSLKQEKREYQEVAASAVKILRGIVDAIAQRDSVAVPVTAGYDSRLLFLASLKTKAEYFVYRNRGMSERHEDIVIAKKLTKLHGKELQIIVPLPKEDSNKNQKVLSNLDFPRPISMMEKEFENQVILNGNCSEVARNYFGYFTNLTSADLAKLSGYPNNAFVKRIYENWLDSSKTFRQESGIHTLDLFYWEEKMGNWAAKKRSETNIVGRSILSPFNCHYLLCTLLSAPRKYRDVHSNKLYDAMINIMDPNCKNIAINPNRKTQIIRLLKRTNVYNLYQYLGLKSGYLKF